MLLHTTILYSKALASHSAGMAHNISGEGAGARVFAVEADPPGDPDGPYRNGGRLSKAGGVPAKPAGIWQKLAAAAGKLIRPTPGAAGGCLAVW